MEAVRFQLRGQTAFVDFISRYRDENDFRVTLGQRTGRVRQYDDGRMVSCCSEFTDEEARKAIGAYRTAEAEAYETWRAQNARLFEPACSVCKTPLVNNEPSGVCSERCLRVGQDGATLGCFGNRKAATCANCGATCPNTWSNPWNYVFHGDQVYCSVGCFDARKQIKPVYTVQKGGSQ
jgi:hypothetical protein